MLNNIKTKDRGFTIVELLIVIVVIAILAAISIVAYNGIQTRSKTSAAAATASTVVKKAEAANAIASAYPSTLAGFSAQSDSSLAGSGITLLASAPTATSATTAVQYQACTAGGPSTGLARVYAWNATNGSTDVTYMGGTASSTCTTWTTVSGGPL